MIRQRQVLAAYGCALYCIFWRHIDVFSLSAPWGGEVLLPFFVMPSGGEYCANLLPLPELV